MNKKRQELDGVRVKIRTMPHDPDDPEPSMDLVATLWVDDSPVFELLRSPLKMMDRPGGPLHDAFHDLATKILTVALEDILKVKGISTKRRKPDYRGEE